MKTICLLFALVLLGLPSFAGISTAPVIVSAGQLPGSVVTTLSNQVWVASQGKSFKTLSAASTNAVAGDTLLVGSGNYFEGTNVCQFPRNVTIVPLGTANITIGLTNTISAVDSNHIYIQPTDGMRLYRGLSISEITVGTFNAIFGTATNTPSATNWLVEFDAPLVDSDGIYWAGTNKFKGVIQNSTLKGYWDEFAPASSVTNTVISFFNVTLDSSNTNQADPVVKRPANINSGANCTYVFNGCTFRANKRLSRSVNYGVVNTSSSSVTILNSCIFDVTSGFDTYNSAQPGNLVLSGCAEQSGNNVTYDTSQGIYGGGSAQTSFINFPAYDFIDGLGLGSWLFRVETNDTAANLVLSSTNNPLGNTPDITIRNFNWDGNSGNGGILAPNFWTYSGGSYNGNASGITNCSVTYFTNIVSGKKQTNNTTLSMTWRVPVYATAPATTLGQAEVDAQVQQPGGSYLSVSEVSIAGGATSVIATNKDTLNFEVPVGWGFCVTNITKTASYDCGLDSAKTNQLTFHP